MGLSQFAHKLAVVLLLLTQLRRKTRIYWIIKNKSMNVIYLIEKETENVAVVECISNVQWASFDAMLIEKWAVKCGKDLLKSLPFSRQNICGNHHSPFYLVKLVAQVHRCYAKQSFHNDKRRQFSVYWSIYLSGWWEVRSDTVLGRGSWGQTARLAVGRCYVMHMKLKDHKKELM